MCDPYIVPGHMMDIILHQHTHQVIRDMPDDDLDDEKTMNDEAHGVLTTISRFLFSPFFFVIYLIDSWVEGRVKKIIRKTAYLRQ